MSNTAEIYAVVEEYLSAPGEPLEKEVCLDHTNDVDAAKEILARAKEDTQLPPGLEPDHEYYILGFKNGTTCPNCSRVITL